MWWFSFMTRQNVSKSLMSENRPRTVADAAGFLHTLALDKMMGDRTHLVSAAVEKRMDAAKGSRNAARDQCLLLVMFRHGWRVSEACGLRLSQGESASRVLHVARLKAGCSTTHSLRGDERRAIKRWRVERAR
jgi:type 1 fimbriae regulatory protein FimB